MVDDLLVAVTRISSNTTLSFVSSSAKTTPFMIMLDAIAVPARMVNFLDIFMDMFPLLLLKLGDSVFLLLIMQ